MAYKFHIRVHVYFIFVQLYQPLTTEHKHLRRPGLRLAHNYITTWNTLDYIVGEQLLSNQ